MWQKKRCTCGARRKGMILVRVTESDSDSFSNRTQNHFTVSAGSFAVSRSHLTPSRAGIYCLNYSVLPRSKYTLPVPGRMCFTRLHVPLQPMWFWFHQFKWPPFLLSICHMALNSDLVDEVSVLLSTWFSHLYIQRRWWVCSRVCVCVCVSVWEGNAFWSWTVMGNIPAFP